MNLVSLTVESPLCVVGVWDKILEPVADRRNESGTLKLFPVYLKGEDLFGFTVTAVTRIVESVRAEMTRESKMNSLRELNVLGGCAV